MKIGYARVSTTDQVLDLQVDALKQAGCEKIFSDVKSGAKEERQGLQNALSYCRSGDVLVVWRLDRLGRSLRHLIDTVGDLTKRGVGFCSLQESIDTTTTGGQLLFHLSGAMAEFERNLIRDRIKAGIESARVRGRVGGRPKKLTKAKWEMIKSVYDGKQQSVREICELAGVSKTTLYQYLAKEKSRKVNEDK